MSNSLLQLTKGERARLLDELNYMSLEEIRSFCSKRGIPYRIVAEYSNGKVKVTKDTDRKPIVLAASAATSGQARPPTASQPGLVAEADGVQDERVPLGIVRLAVERDHAMAPPIRQHRRLRPDRAL